MTRYFQKILLWNARAVKNSEFLEEKAMTRFKEYLVLKELKYLED